MHPADHLRGTKSDKLKGRKIVLGLTGSIAAVESIRLCRELIRHGAEVHVVMSPDARTIVHPYALEFASGRPAITEIDGGVQHVALCGDVPDKAELLLIAPATANTISKIACGIDDTPVTTFAATALGTGIQVVVVPAMHGSMIRNKAVIENISKLKEMGVLVLEPRMEEAKAKMPDIEHIVTYAIRTVGRNDLKGRKVLVIAGSTEEPMDDIRVITNKSSGETGIEFARAAYEHGASVDLWMGRCDTPIPSYFTTTRFSSFKELAALMGKVDHDVVFFPAAVSDYSPDKFEGKMQSDKESITVTFKRNPKLIDAIEAKVVVGFKAQAKLDDEGLLDDAKLLLDRSKCSLVVANKIEEVSKGRTRILLVEKNGLFINLEGTKFDVAERVVDRVARMIQ